ncbi:hypothetical protein [Siphonobacter curvatus]|nr:hypothetical protein [Siphonobacter curvatus]
MNEEEIREQLRLFIHHRLTEVERAEAEIQIQSNADWKRWYAEELTWINKYKTFERKRNRALIRSLQTKYPIQLRELSFYYRWKNWLLGVGLLSLGLGGGYFFWSTSQRYEVAKENIRFIYVPIYDVTASSGFVETKRMVATDSVKTEWIANSDSSYWFSGAKLQVKLGSQPDWHDWNIYKDEEGYYLQTPKDIYLLQSDPNRFFSFQAVNRK